MAKVKYYGVKKGLVPGVYTSWDECKAQVDGFSGAEYKSFRSEEEAKAYISPEKDDEVYDKSGYVSENMQRVEAEFQALGITYVPVDDNTQHVSEPAFVHDEVYDGPYAFVDGSFNADTGVYGYGGFVCDGTKKYPLQGHNDNPDMASMRNVAGEIDGSMAAVKKAEELGIRKMTMYYDYNGIEQWAIGGWKTNNPCTQAYAQFMQSDNRKVQLDFVHTKGHTGIAGNEIADAMAKKAVGLELTPKMQKYYDMLMSAEDVDKSDIKPNTNRIQPTGGRRLPRVADEMEDNSLELD